jgi:EmrB/QacA subfamily drug resistance transporter
VAEPVVGDAPAEHGGSAGLTVASAQGRWVLLVTILGSGLAQLDATVVNLALPHIGIDLHVGLRSLQWVVTSYTLTLAALLLTGGALGDSFGRRRVFALGVGLFALASLACGMAPGESTLISARLVQGVGGALLTPGSLAILQASFAPEERAKAIGAWTGLGGVAGALGPIVGGLLLRVGSWRLVFLINPPIAVLVLLVTFRHVPETKASSGDRHVDVQGTACAAGGLALLTYGLIEDRWPLTVAGVAVLGLFVLVEHREARPMLPPGIFGSRQFTGANLVTFVQYGAMGGVFFLLPVELQSASGFSPLVAGAALLPVTVLMLLFAARSGAIAARIGPRLQMTAGPVLVGVGLLLLRRVGVGASYWVDVLPAVVVFALGLVVVVAPLTATALASAPAEHVGLASAVNNDVARVAGLLAVAVLPAAAGISGAAYLHPAELAAGFRTAVTVAAALSLVAAAIAAALIRNPRLPG